MPKRPDTQETVQLVLEILKRIPRHKRVSAAEVHTELKKAGFPRDLRTIQRQLEMLTDYFGLDRDKSEKPFGYRWDADAKSFSVPGLNEQESLLLKLAEQYLTNLLPASLMKGMAGFFEQAGKNVNPLSGDVAGREWLNKVRVVSETQPLLPPKIDDSVFEEVSNALYRNQWLNLDYKNAKGEKKLNADVMPLGLAQQGPRLYLVCRFSGYENERSLALHRIIKAKASTLTFERPPSFDLQKYDDDGRFGFGEGKRVRLTFCIDKKAGRHLLESPLSADQQVTDLETEYEISATVVDSERLQWWLRGFGEGVRGVRFGA